MNLPDDPDRPERGNLSNLAAAKTLYAEAEAIFRSRGEDTKARLVAAAVAELDAELAGAESRQIDGG